MTVAEWIALLILDAALSGPSFYPGYIGWDDAYDEWSRLLDKAEASGWTCRGGGP